MAKTFKGGEEYTQFLKSGGVPSAGDRVESGSDYYSIENVRTTPEGVSFITAGPTVITSTGERQGQGQTYATYKGKFPGAGFYSEGPISGVSEQDVLSFLKYNEPTFQNYIAPPPQDRPVITGPRLGESGATPAGQDNTPVIDPRFGTEPIPGIEYQRRYAEMQTAEARKQIAELPSGQTGGITLTPSSRGGAMSQTEMNQNPPVLGSLNPQVTGSIASVAGLKDTTPTQQALLTEMQRIQTQSEAQATGLKTLLADKPKPLDVATVTSQAMQALGLPADFTKQQFQSLQTTSAEILSLTQSLNQINVQEQQALQRVGSQPIPMENISRQQSEVQRTAAIQKASIAADITAKNAYMENLRGNFQLVNQIVDKAVTLATYVKTQEIADFKWMFDNYKDEFDSLTKREQTLYDNLITSLEKQATATQEDLRFKMKLYLDNKIAMPDTATLGNMSAEEVARYVSQNRPADTSVVDTRNQLENKAAYVAQVATYPSREAALADLERNRTVITLTAGVDGYNTVLAEINRLFPEVKQKPKVSTTITPRVGPSGAPSILKVPQSALPAGFNTLGEYLKSQGVEQSFFDNLFK